MANEMVNWEEAPPRAQYHAQDRDGRLYWYECEPEPDLQTGRFKCLYVNWCAFHEQTESNDEWAETVTTRPIISAPLQNQEETDNG
jgi:hypothetical protein